MSAGVVIDASASVPNSTSTSTSLSGLSSPRATEPNRYSSATPGSALGAGRAPRSFLMTWSRSIGAILCGRPEHRPPDAVYPPLRTPPSPLPSRRLPHSSYGH